MIAQIDLLAEKLLGFCHAQPYSREDVGMASMTLRSVPSHPGYVLRDRVLPGLGLSVSEAARKLRISRQTLHVILGGRASVTPEMAMRFAQLSDTQPEFWLSMQQSYDLWRAEEGMADVLRGIPTLSLPDALRAEIGCHGHAH
jgi:addiction module HigA family antidote